MSGLFLAEINDDPEAQALARKWIEALRSGDYQQGKGRLKTDAGGYCCLGVACNLIDPEGWDYREVGEDEETGEPIFAHVWTDNAGEDTWTVLPTGAQIALRLSSEEGRMDGHPDESTLAGLNDGGSSFALIADFIECELADALEPVTTS